MEDALRPRVPGRGDARLLEHCAALGAARDVGPSAFQRLEDVLGIELAAMLLRALATNPTSRLRGVWTAA